MSDLAFVLYGILALIALRIIVAIGAGWVVLAPILIVGGVGYWIAEWPGAIAGGVLVLVAFGAYAALTIDWEEFNAELKEERMKEKEGRAQQVPSAAASTSRSSGSIIGAILVMFVLSVLLSFIPVLGPVISGIVGGRTAGSVGGALAAVFLPSVVLGIALYALASTLTGLPLIGAIAGAGGAVMALAHIGPLLIGAIIGGLLS